MTDPICRTKNFEFGQMCMVFIFIDFEQKTYLISNDMYQTYYETPFSFDTRAWDRRWQSFVPFFRFFVFLFFFLLIFLCVTIFFKIVIWSSFWNVIGRRIFLPPSLYLRRFWNQTNKCWSLVITVWWFQKFNDKKGK